MPSDTILNEVLVLVRTVTLRLAKLSAFNYWLYSFDNEANEMHSELK